MNRVIPAHKDSNGFMVSAQSECCETGLVYYDKDEGQYVSWPGWGMAAPRSELRCYLCNEVAEIGEVKDD